MATMQKSTKKTQKAHEPENFEKALQELEELVANMENGTMPLDDLLINYQRGAQLMAFCKNKLKSVEQQVALFEDGELKPISHNDGTL